MAVRISEEVSNSTKECRFLHSAFQTEGPRIAGTLTGLTQPNLGETDETPGFGSVIVGLDRNTQASLGKLVASDANLTAAVGWESTLRKEHQVKSKEQGLLLVDLRGTVNGQYVEPDLDNLGLQPVDVREPMTVARRSLLISERFEARNLAKMLGQSRFEDPVDLGPYVTQIKASAKVLLDIGGQIDEAERLTARARLEKNILQAEHDKIFLRSARVFEDFCRLAGDDELADKIRRTVRSRPSGQETGEDESGKDEPGNVTEPIGDVEEFSQEV